MFSFEMKRALVSKKYYISILLGLILAVWHFIELRIRMNKSGDLHQPLIQAFIGGDYQTWIPQFYRLIVPLLSTIPFSWSYQEDYMSGYLRHVFLYKNKRRALSVRYFVAFILGGVASIFPLVCSLVLSATKYPNQQPLVYRLLGGPESDAFLAETFYLHPIIFIFLYLIAMFLFGGVFAGIGLIIGAISDKRSVVLILPMILVLYEEIIKMQHGDVLQQTKRTLRSMMDIQNGVQATYYFPLMAVLIIVPWIFFIVIGERKEVLGDAK